MPTYRARNVGMNALTDTLKAAGAHVVQGPPSDGRVDLLAYSDGPVLPLKVAASTGPGFTLDRTWSTLDGLRVVHCWLMAEGDPAGVEFYVSTYGEMHAILSGHTWADQPSWRDHGRWTNDGTERVIELMRPYRVGPEGWRALLES